MKVDPLDEFESRIAKGSTFFPNFCSMLRKKAATNVKMRDGVLLLGHSPEIAPESYCHVLYPPLNDSILSAKLNTFRTCPQEIYVLLQMMNGATLFHGGCEIWGFHTIGDSFGLPAYDIIDEASSGGYDGSIAFASNSCGDTMFIDCQCSFVTFAPRDTGLSRMTFRTIDDWITFSGEINK